MYTYNFKNVGNTFIINVPKDLNKLDILKPERLKEQYGGSYKVYFNVQNTTAKFLTFYIKTNILCAVSPKSDFSCELPQEVFTDYMIECKTMQNDEVFIADSGSDVIVTFTEGVSLGYSNNYNNNFKNLGGNFYRKLDTIEHINDVYSWTANVNSNSSPFHDYKHIQTTSNDNDTTIFTFNADNKFYNSLSFNGTFNASVKYTNNSNFRQQGNNCSPLAYIIPNTNYSSYITGSFIQNDVQYNTYQPSYNTYIKSDWFSSLTSAVYGIDILFQNLNNDIIDSVFINCLDSNNNNNNNNIFVAKFDNVNNFSPVLMAYNNNVIVDNYQTLVNFKIPINNFLKNDLKYKIVVTCHFYIMYVANVLVDTVITYKTTIDYILQGFWTLS